MRTSSAAVGRGDILARRLGDSVSIPLVATKDVAERHPALSPDGKWLAYRSEETGKGEVYARPFPNVNDGKWLVSLDEGGGEEMSNQSQRLSTALAGRYLIERELGAGGMATVYLANDIKHDRKVALKLLKGGGSPTHPQWDTGTQPKCLH